jgi:hypothetical protein
MNNSTIALWWLAALVLFGDPARAESDLGHVEAKLKLNSLGRYMQEGAHCQNQVRKEWEGFPTVMCTYSGSSGAKDISVIMLNAEPPQIARWLVTACRDARAQHIRHCAERLALQTTCQSGFQFPIAGFVDEGEIFSFRNGVTARMTGTQFWKFTSKNFSDATKPVFDNEPESAGKYARISSTERKQFADLVGQPLSTFDGLAWIATARKEYQAAWGQDSNRLMTARVKSSLSQFDQEGWGDEFNHFCVEVAGCPSQQSAPGKCAKQWHSWDE